MANILKQLSDEHDEVTKLIETLSAGEGDREAIFEELFHNLLIHSKAEEQELYSQVRTLDEDISSKIEDSYQEHQEVEKLLRQMQKVVSDDEKFAELLEDLRDNVEHHVEEEEGELFPLVEQHLAEDELVEMNKRYLEARKTVLEFAEMTKEELYAEAQAAEVPGRSKMTRDELEEELRKK
jgi:hemerythrin superfamily protein